MNAIDNYYFKSFTDFSKSFYDWERIFINLGCSESDINILSPSENLTEDGKKVFSVLVHEYIHFLQNFSSAWGAPIYSDFILSYMKIGSSSAISNKIINIPIEIKNIDNDLLKDGFLLRKDTLTRLNTYSKYIYNKFIDLSKIVEINQNDKCIVLTNGRITLELGVKVIREHMAHLGTQLFLGKSDIKINEINERIFVDNSNIPFSIKPEYWIIFEYFYSLNKFSNTARGLLKLMQICLSTLKPEKTILLFFRWFDINTKNFSEGNDFIILINSWLKSSDIQHNMNNDLEISIGHCECVLVPIIKHLEENDIFKFTRDIINFSITNLRKTKGGIDLYKDNDNFEDILYWKNIIYKFGTGIIKFNDKVVIQGSKDHCTSMKDSFMFLLSSSLIIKKIVENDLTDCPFLDEIPICKANFRGIKDCISNPFYIDNPENKEEKCLFRNGVFLLGLQDRLKQNNQY